MNLRINVDEVELRKRVKTAVGGLSTNKQASAIKESVATGKDIVRCRSITASRN